MPSFSCLFSDSKGVRSINPTEGEEPEQTVLAHGRIEILFAAVREGRVAGIHTRGVFPLLTELNGRKIGDDQPQHMESKKRKQNNGQHSGQEEGHENAI